MQSGRDGLLLLFSRPVNYTRSFSRTDLHIARLRAILRDVYVVSHNIASITGLRGRDDLWRPRVYYILTDRYWSLVDRAATRGINRTERSRWINREPAKSWKESDEPSCGCFIAGFWLGNTRSSLWWPISITDYFIVAVQPFGPADSYLIFALSPSLSHTTNIVHDRTDKNYTAACHTPL